MSEVVETPAGWRPDALYTAMGKVLSDYHWRAFCDSWLSIGLAAAYVHLLGHPTSRLVEKRARAVVSGAIGRTLRKKLR